MIEVKKTTKLFINGEFPRTESGRSLPVKFHNSEKIFSEICRASRKDLRNATEAAKEAQAAWAKRTAYNRGQILYRMAEMMQGKRQELQSILQKVLGRDVKQYTLEVDKAIDALVYYAGFADKYSQVTASVNPVSGPFHNFTTPEAVGVVGLFSEEVFSLNKLCAQLASVICSGNTTVVVLPAPGAAMLSELGETFKTSDLPAGVINLLSGLPEELLPHLGQHMEIHSILCSSEAPARVGEFKEMAVANMKRVVPWQFEDCELAPIMAFTEAKTIWHPVGV